MINLKAAKFYESSEKVPEMHEYSFMFFLCVFFVPWEITFMISCLLPWLIEPFKKKKRLHSA